MVENLVTVFHGYVVDLCFKVRKNVPRFQREYCPKAILGTKKCVFGHPTVLGSVAKCDDGVKLPRDSPRGDHLCTFYRWAFKSHACIRRLGDKDGLLHVCTVVGRSYQG